MQQAVNNQVKNRKTLSVFSLVMINVIAVDSLRTLPISAEYGLALVFFYILGAIIFFIPIALVSAELATGWPASGGLYVWVREAFGKRWGFITIWLQWIYNVVWYPTILAFIAATLGYLISPQLANDRYYLLFTVLAIFWLATFVNCFGMRISSWVSTIGALFGTIIPIMFIIVLGTVWLVQGKTIHLDFSWQQFFPNLGHVDSLVLLTGVLFGLVGMEMSAVHAGDVRNPQRDYPRALLYSTIIIFATLMFGSLAIAIVVPQQQLSLVSGLIDAFSIFFNTYHLSWMVPVIAGLIILGGVSGVSAWIIGPTKGLLIAAQDKNIPEFFNKVNRYGAPTRLLLLQGIIFTALCSVFILMKSVNESYWILSALTAQLALLVYVLMFAAFIKLRYIAPNKPRSYQIPGGKPVAWLVTLVAIITCVVTIILGFVPPSQIKIGNLALYEGFLGLGIVLFVIVPWWFCPHDKPTESRQVDSPLI